MTDEQRLQMMKALVKWSCDLDRALHINGRGILANTLAGYINHHMLALAGITSPEKAIEYDVNIYLEGEDGDRMYVNPPSGPEKLQKVSKKKRPNPLTDNQVLNFWEAARDIVRADEKCQKEGDDEGSTEILNQIYHCGIGPEDFDDFRQIIEMASDSDFRSPK